MILTFELDVDSVKISCRKHTTKPGV